MVRLRNDLGAVVDVPEEKVGRLFGSWTRVDEDPKPKRRPPRRAKADSESDSE